MEKTLLGRGLIVLALVLFALLQLRLWFGEGGVADVLRLKKSVAAIATENDKLRERNRVLEAEVRDLKQGLEAIEEHARMDLGMIKSNETFYLVTGPRKAAAPATSPAPAQP